MPISETNALHSTIHSAELEQSSILNNHQMLTASDKRRALRAFKQRGIVVHVGALEQLDAGYKKTDTGTWPDFLDKAFDLLSRPDGAKDGILTKSLAQSIASRLQRETFRSDGDLAASLEVIDIFTVPQWRPNSIGSRSSMDSTMTLHTPSKPTVDASALAKSEMFRLRYELQLSKTLRNDSFKSPLSGVSTMSKKSSSYELTGVESLRSNQGEKLVLGMLTQLEEGVWYLEDINGSVKLDLSNALITAGLHTDGSFIIAQGRLAEEDGTDPVFQVSAMGTPPHETREQTVHHLGTDTNLFGGQFDLVQTESLIQMERDAVNSVFLLLSDVAVDNPSVLAGIKHLFQGYLEDEVVPTVIVFMGNFLSHPFGQCVDDVQSLQDGFARLGEMIKTEFAPLAEASTFVLVPSTNDAGPCNILPRPPLPKLLTRPFIDAIGSGKVFSATNPCRIRYMTQEIVIMRDNILQKMVRHCSIKPDFNETGLMCEHLFKTITDQAYLSPLPLTARPVLWAHHHSLWLFPTPHVVVTADKVDGFICKYGGSLGLNPGSFATDFSFLVYLPAERRAQQCSLNSEDVEPNRGTKNGENAEPNVPLPSPPDSMAEPEEGSTKKRLDGDEDGGDDSINAALEDGRRLQTGENRRVLQETADAEESDEESEDEDEHEHEVGDEDVSDAAEESDLPEESDDESLLVPAEGVKKIDIKALVRNAIAEDTSTLGQTDGNDSDRDDNSEAELDNDNVSVE